MRKHSSLIILFLSASMIIGSYLAYQKIIYPIYLNNNSQEIKTMLDKEFDLKLCKLPEQSKIYGMEIEISPNNGANYTVIIPEADEVPYEARVKRGKEFVHKINWHDDSCMIRFIPNGKSTDSITVTYRFLGLNR